MKFSKINKAYLLLIFSVIGPGIITASVDNDPGGIAIYSVAGASFGYTLLWTIIPIIILLIIIQEMCTRMGVVTRKGLSDLIRENFGLKATFFIMIALLFVNFTNTISEFAGVAASSEIFGISRYIGVPLAAIFVWVIVVKGSYKKVEKIFLLASLFYLTYIISGFLAGPDWKTAAKEIVFPSIQFNSSYLIMIIGMIGTTIAPWMQFYLQSSIVEKKVRLKNYKFTKIDVVIGSIVTGLVAFFIIVACASTLFASNIKINDAADAAIALKPLAGDLASELFAFGLLNAAIFSASILPLSTAYCICEGFGWERGIDKKMKQAKRFYALYTFLIVAGAAIILIPGFPLLSIMIWSQILNGILLPVVLIFMLLLINNKDIMGRYVNTRLWNILTTAISLVLILMSIILIFSYL